MDIIIFTPPIYVAPPCTTSIVLPEYIKEDKKIRESHKFQKETINLLTFYLENIMEV
jgi:hypothetical protein